MNSQHRHLTGAFAAMVFVGASWGANLPITKVLLHDFDLIPLAALRTAAGVVVLMVILALAEGVRALRIELDFRRFALLGLMMGGFFCVYSLGIQFSNPITAAAVGVVGPLVAAVTVRIVTGLRFDPGFPVALGLTLLGGAILASSVLLGQGALTFGGGEILLLLSNVLWTLYSLKAQAWFDRASQLHRSYVASVSAMCWTVAVTVVVIWLGWSRSPIEVHDGWVWAQLLIIAVFASGLGGYFWNVGVSRLGVAVASLWVNLVPFFAVLWSMTYGFMPNGFQIAGGLVALSGVIYMQWRRLATTTAS